MNSLRYREASSVDEADHDPTPDGAWLTQCALCGSFLPKLKPDDKTVKCPQCHQEWIVVDEADHDPTPEEPRIWCQYCGGTGDEEWFKCHSHGPNPFGDGE